jgi:type VI secretion system secreted protein Hcp
MSATQNEPAVGRITKTFTATKYMDKTSPLLNNACCNGTNLGTVTVTIGRNDRGTIIPIITYKLENSVISSVSVGGGAGDKPVETMTINYSKITWTFIAPKVDGEQQADVTAAFDVSTND